MGYESRVYIVNEWDDNISFVDKEIGKPLGEIIAKFDLCCVENGFLDVFKDEAKKAWEEMAEAQKKAHENPYDNQAQKEMQEAQARYHEISATVLQAQKDIQKATKNIKESFRGMLDVTYAKDGIGGLQTEFENLASSAKDSGFEITAGFAQSIRDGSANVNESMDFLASLMTFEEVRNQAQGTGEEIDASLVSGILNNSSSVEEATKNLIVTFHKI